MNSILSVSSMYCTIRQSVLFTISVLTLWANCSESLASCGDWLADPNDSMQRHTRPELSPTTSNESTEVPREQPRPHCSGPECRQVPATPLQPLPRQVDPFSNDALLSKVFTKSNASVKIGSGWALFDESVVGGFHFDLERPPQFDL